MFKSLKIKKELKKFQEFKKNYKFDFKQLTKSDDGSLFIDGECVREGENQHIAFENDFLVNAGYISGGSQLSKVLSNLFPYEFVFKGFKVQSIEGIFQSLKFKDKKCQKQVLKYSGFNANRIRACSDYDWRETQMIYFMGKAMKRDSKEYADFIDEMYISLVVCNPLYKNALKNVKDRYILHSMGNDDKTQTTLSRFEFEYELNCLKDYILIKKNKYFV